MNNDPGLLVHRDFYSNFLVATAESSDEGLAAAFRNVAREDYVGRGPWSIFVGQRYILTPTDDPTLLYQDILVGLAPERGINNGQPTLHARCLSACRIKPGERIAHVGAGTGYYTAILAELAGATGTITAYEIEPDLADRARTNLAARTTVSVDSMTRVVDEIPIVDVVYVSAGATHPPSSWLDALDIGGRLLFPLTGSSGFGAILLITRLGGHHYSAEAVTPAGFIPCVGARDTESATAVDKALHNRLLFATKTLWRGTTPDDTACCVGNGWWLSSA